MKKYSIVYADPPWSYNDKRGNDPAWGAMTYDTMSLEQIKEMPVRGITDENCMLFLWVTFPLLREGLEVIKAWGFEYKTLGFSWIKTNKRQNLDQVCFIPTDPDLFFGIGYYTKSNCEVCLIGVKGRPIKQSDLISSVVISPIGRHSEKPHEVRKRIVELCGDLPRIELFARTKPEGWDVFGNEVVSDVSFSVAGTGTPA